MFAQEDTQGAYIAKFFASHPNEKLSWIHALGNKQYYTTELALLRKSVEARELVEKHVCDFSCLAITYRDHLRHSYSSCSAWVSYAFSPKRTKKTAT